MSMMQIMIIAATAWTIKSIVIRKRTQNRKEFIKMNVIRMLCNKQKWKKECSKHEPIFNGIGIESTPWPRVVINVMPIMKLLINNLAQIPFSKFFPWMTRSMGPIKMKISLSAQQM